MLTADLVYSTSAPSVREAFVIVGKTLSPILWLRGLDEKNSQLNSTVTMLVADVE